MKKIKVWDGPLRLFHWALVTAFALSIYSAFQDKFGIYADMHLYAGVTILGLVSWRILWGVIGSETARFTSFIKGPKAIRAYLRVKRKPGEPYPWVGHNPLGALSVTAMLTLLLVQSLLGLFASDDMLFSGPFSDKAGGKAGLITGIHETIGYILIGLVALHILVIIGYAARRVNLIAPMIAGTKRAVEGTPAPKMASPLLAMVLGAGVAAAVWLIIF